MLKLVHITTDAYYRSPRGALVTETPVTLRLRVFCEQKEIHRVSLYYLYGLNRFAASYQPMAPEAGAKSDVEAPHTDYRCTVVLPDVGGLFYYWFEVQLTDGRYRWCFPDASSSGLSGVTEVVSREFATDGTEPIDAFQITVYEQDFKTPDSLKGAVMYQIFPDRFARGTGFDVETARSRLTRREQFLHEDWDEEVDIEGIGPSGYEACDFFGGTFNGIREHLDYLSSFGVTCLYLNPIFEARSNHRYDTGNYFKPDALLGTTAEFEALCAEAAERGIRIILDGVFSHTGADSRYFNRYGHYSNVGAWQARSGKAVSEYESWYRFSDDSDEVYRSWWGFSNLPDVYEYDLNYRNYILGDDGVVAFWLRKGNRGYRLDVSDELPDSFLRSLRRRVKACDPEAFILGEVWEEPTAKISYGAHRDFMFGRTHDATMNYPFRTLLFDWLTGAIKAETLCCGLTRLLQDLPTPSIPVMMNLLGSHDTERAINRLSGVATPPERRDQAERKLTENERTLGRKRMWLATLFQVAFPGIAALYYGDEEAMEGFNDPFNRRTFRRGHAPVFAGGMRDIYCLRGTYRALRHGDVRLTSSGDHVVIVERFTNLDDERVMIVINRHTEATGPLTEVCGLDLPPLSGVVVTAKESRLFQYDRALESDGR